MDWIVFEFGPKSAHILNDFYLNLKSLNFNPEILAKDPFQSIILSNVRQSSELHQFALIDKFNICWNSFSALSCQIYIQNWFLISKNRIFKEFGQRFAFCYFEEKCEKWSFCWLSALYIAFSR